jgi:RNA polymerase sigma factor (sigma-70 family)
MSAAIQLPNLWAQATPALQPQLLASAIHHIQRLHNPPQPDAEPEPVPEPSVYYAFYRKHTEKLLRRYLYASMQVGRSPNILADSVGRGWVSSRRVRTFEDALIFVLDVERCLKKLTPVDRQLITRVLLQEYTQKETASILGLSLRTISNKLPQAIDRLTETLVESDLLVLPD